MFLLRLENVFSFFMSELRGLLIAGLWRLIFCGFTKERRSGERRPRRHGGTEAGKQTGKRAEEVEEAREAKEAKEVKEVEEFLAVWHLVVAWLEYPSWRAARSWLAGWGARAEVEFIPSWSWPLMFRNNGSARGKRRDLYVRPKSVRGLVHWSKG
jgi:hypothetical protein